MMTATIAVLTPFLLVWFTSHQREHRLPLRSIPQTVWENQYYLHVATYLLMAVFKTFTDSLNDPLKAVRGDYTRLVYAVEGKATLYIQRAFENPLLTDILNFHYLFIYLFLILFTPLYFIYSRDRDMADKAVLNYVMIYILAVPYYLFFNVEVTSTFIPGMKALLYHGSAAYFEFFTTHDPLDNAFPSLHMAIPFGLLFVHFLHVRENGMRLRDWRHWRYHRFIGINTAVFMFSILYLGIHWVLDILTGILLGLIGALFVHAVQPLLRDPRARAPAPQRSRDLLRNSVAPLVLAVLLTTPLLSVEADAPVPHPNVQLGPGDVNADVFGPVPTEGPIRITVKNLGPNISVEALLVEREAVEGLAEDGRLNWTALEAGHPVNRLTPNATLQLEATGESAWYVLVLHDPRPASANDTIEDMEAFEPATILVRAVYPDDGVAESLALSIPSQLVTAFVLHRQWRLHRHRMAWFSSQPTP